MEAGSAASRPIERNREDQAQRELDNLRAIARLFDQAFRVPGTNFRFGIDALFGFIPGLGDIAGGIVAVYALRIARQLGAPVSIQLRMLGNIAIDAIVGAVPFFGDLFDFAFKAQTRNLELLDQWRQTPIPTARRSKRALILMPIAIFLVFAALTALGVFLLVQLYQWIAA